MQLRLRAILGAGAMMLLSGIPGQAAEAIHWQTNFASAKAAAKKSHKLIFADFYAEWWGTCKELDRVVYTDKKVIQAAGQVVPLKMDVDKKNVAPIADKYKVSALPGLIVLDADGKLVGTVPYTTSPAAFATSLNRIVKAHSTGKKAPPARPKPVKK
jgi:thiol:disulfide interchange protein